MTHFRSNINKSQPQLNSCTIHEFAAVRYIILAQRIRISEVLPWKRKSYLTHAILPRTSSNVTL